MDERVNNPNAPDAEREIPILKGVDLKVHRGEVLVLASVPSFDPNEFNKGISGPL